MNNTFKSYIEKDPFRAFPLVAISIIVPLCLIGSSLTLIAYKLLGTWVFNLSLWFIVPILSIYSLGKFAPS